MPEPAGYRLEVRDSAAKEMRLLPSEMKPRIVAAIDALCDDPRPRGFAKIKGSAVGLYRIRVGVYRVVYSIDDGARMVVITRVRHRREVYG